VAVTHVSNAIGTLNPIETIIRRAHAKNIPVLIDGAQAVPHLKIDVQALDCDFYTFSSHKVYGPTGVGVLYGKARWLEQLPPYQGGGEMILKVTLSESKYNELPYKFEAGTPAIAEVIALKAALDFFMNLPLNDIFKHEQQLLHATTEMIEQLPGSRIIGTADHKVGVVSFTLEGIHPHDIGTIADQQGVALRTGHHCAMPLMDFFNIPATTRVSFGVYNTEQDIEQLSMALQEVLKLFKKKS
jgi:cysteine desulfurase/selenocysteine lyase